MVEMETFAGLTVINYLRNVVIIDCTDTVFISQRSGTDPAYDCIERTNWHQHVGLDIEEIPMSKIR